METFVGCFVFGILLGIYCGHVFYRKKSKRDKQYIAQLSQKILYLERKETKRLKNLENYRKKLSLNDQQISEQNLSDYQNQMRILQNCALKVKKPINREAVQYFYYLNEWIKQYHPNWYVSFEVSMGAFITTQGSDNNDETARDLAFRSYNSKRVDFLLIDHRGFPRCAIEYNGSGHDLSGNADERMQVKILVFKKVGIPLIELSEGMEKKQVFMRLNKLL
ncbi:DUF2726 domain-containing protein [Commensalibacter oyaizuii]|uniref:DUF2726 domain-containing protein n=1 Tax=Commensalibacter oyaizuii TaxID=3043873 RepID=A0ABT6PYM2_9PROT|nr:DUF2726 domain-containing protein [Commensalibacter sp. TBRC 16381]MDI2089959.1 DUF2726 domain-containing protein [Commensalibacter sp. TBRC 16381]